MATIPSRYLDRKDSLTYYGKETPYHFQDEMTKDILKSASMSAQEALKFATEEQKSIQRIKKEREQDEGDYMYQVNQLQRGKKLVDQAERGARFYEKYKQRNLKRLTPDRTSIMIQNVKSKRNEIGGKRKLTKRRKNKSKTRKNKNRKLKRS
jgi:hypothetical protein